VESQIFNLPNLKINH